MPDCISPVVVVAADELTITVNNPTTGIQSVTFRVERVHTIHENSRFADDSAPVDPPFTMLLWQGACGGSVSAQNPMALPALWSAGIAPDSASNMNPPDSQFIDLIMIRAGSLVGLRARLNNAVIAGTVTAEVTKNGVGTGFTAIIGAGFDTVVTIAAIGAFPYVEGDKIGLIWATDANYSGGDYIECWIEVEEEI